MANNSYRNNKRFWFGTRDWMQWIDVPMSGANVSPTGWGTDGTLLSGGGFAQNSQGTHKRYAFEWRKSSARRMAQLMKDYRDGTYGTGLLYFQDPLTYDTNVLPARWASPAMTLDQEGSTLVYGVLPTMTPTSNFKMNALPSRTAVYNLGSTPTGYPGEESAVFIPIPEGYDLRIGAVYSFTGTGGVYYTPVNDNDTLGTAVKLATTAVNATDLAPLLVSGVGIKGIMLWVGRSSAVASTASLTGMIAKLTPRGVPITVTTPWVGGQGHSGVTFQGTPTYINNTGVDGGQVSFAASFVETGSWLYG